MDARIAKSTETPSPTARCIVVIPCYNEEARLRPRQFSDFLEGDDQVNFLFVNDGSSDGTLRILESLRAKHPDRIEVLDRQPNGGKAETVRGGMFHAMALGGVAYTGFWDADLATPLGVIPQLLRKLVETPNLQMIFGSRVRLLGHAIHRNPLRHYLGRCFATAVSIVLGLPIYDSQCGAKLFRITPVLQSILALPFQSHWIFDVEIIARFLAIHNQEASFALDAIYEHPLPRWEDVAGSKVRPGDFFVAFWELWKIRRTFRRERRQDHA
jgi:dolichyl-phosphate beta-glucosyltransferase